jgi:hypothetical protein
MNRTSQAASPGLLARLRRILPLWLLATGLAFRAGQSQAAPLSLDNVVFTIHTIGELVNLTPAAFPECGDDPNCSPTVNVDDPLRGGIFTLTNTVAGTNTGTLFASVGFPGQSWRREYSGDIVVTWFGTRGAPYDDTVPISNAIAAEEANGPAGGVYFPPGTYRAQGLHVHHCYLKGAGMTIGPWNPATMLELVPNATNDLIYFDESGTADVPVTLGISDMTLNGHRSANLVNPVTITSSTDRNTFFVDPAKLPATLVDDGTGRFYDFCFFYTAANRYVGYGIVKTVDFSTGQIGLLSGFDRYATVSVGDSLPAGWKVCFTPNRTTTYPVRLGGGPAQTYTDPVAAGRSGIVITSAYVELNNICVWDFHTGIAGYTAGACHFNNIWCQNNSFAGIANADGWSADSHFERIFVQGFYYEYPTDAPESPALANYTWRHTAHGMYGLWNVSTYTDLSIAACVVGIGDTGGEGSDITYLLLDAPIKSGLSGLGSASNPQALKIGTLEARSWGDFGSTNSYRQLPSNVGIYSVFDQIAGSRYYSIGKLAVHSFDYVPTNWFSAVFYYYASTTNSPVAIDELTEFTGAYQWFIGGGAAPVIRWINPKISTAASLPDGWHQSGTGIGYGVGGVDSLTLGADGSVSVPNLTVGNLTFTNLNFVSGTLGVTNLNFTNLSGATGIFQSVSIGSLASGALATDSLLAGTGTITNLTAGSLTAGSGSITALNTFTFNSPTGIISGFNTYYMTAGAGLFTNLTAQSATVLNGNLGTVTITNLFAPAASITSLGVNNINSPNGTINIFNSTSVSGGTGTFGTLNTPQLMALGGTAGTLSVTNLNSPNASITALGVGSLNAATGIVSTLSALNLNGGNVVLTNATIQGGSFLNGTAGTLSVTNLIANAALIADLDAGTLNAPTGIVSVLTAYNLNAGSATLTNGLVQNGTLLNATAGTLTVTNLLAPSASITSLGANNINSPNGTINNLSASTLSGGTGSFGTLSTPQLNALGGTAGALTITNLTAPNAVITTLGAGSLNAATGVVSSLSALNFNGGNVVLTNATIQGGSFLNGTAGTLNITNLISTNATITTLGAGTLNAPTGTVSVLTAYNLNAGSATLTNGLIQGAILLNGTAGTLTVTNLLAPSASITSLGANNINSPNGTINNLNSSSLVGGSGSFSTLTTPLLNALGGTAGSLTITNLTSTTASIGGLSAGSMNAATGSVSTLSALNLNGGNVVLTNATIQGGTFLNGTAGTLTVTNLTAPSATITAIGANTINSPNGSINNLTSTTVTGGTGSFGNLSTPQLTALAGTAGALTVTNLTSPNGTITTLGAGSLNAATGLVSTLTAQNLYSGTATLTNALIQFGTVLNGTAGTLAVTNLNAPNATITTLGAGSFSAPTGTVSVLTAYNAGIGGATITNAIIQTGAFLNGTAGTLTVTNLAAPAAAITTLSAGTVNAPTGTINQFNTLSLNAQGAGVGVLTATNLTSPNAILVSARVGSGIFTNFYAPTAWVDNLTSTNYTGPLAGFNTLNAGTLTVSNSFSVNGNLPVGGTVTASRIVTTNASSPAVVAGPGGLLLTGAETNNTVIYSGPFGGFHVWDKNLSGVVGRVFNLSVSTSDIQFLVGGANPSPRNVSFGGDYGYGTNIRGAELSFKAPQGSGNNASGGNIHFYTPDVTASGTAVQAITEKFTVMREGSVWLRTPPATPVPAPGKLYSDGGNLYYSDTNYVWLPILRSRPGSGLLTFNFNTIAAGRKGTATATVNFSAVGENVVVNPRTALSDDLSVAYSRISAANTVEIALRNLSDTNMVVGAVQFDVRIVK